MGRRWVSVSLTQAPNESQSSCVCVGRGEQVLALRWSQVPFSLPSRLRAPKPRVWLLSSSVFYARTPRDRVWVPSPGPSNYGTPRLGQNSISLRIGTPQGCAPSLPPLS